MIRLLSGVTRKGSRLVYPSDGPFELTTKEEKHLVETGAAEFITEAPQTGVATPHINQDAQGTGANISATTSVPEGQETPSSAAPSDSHGPIHDDMSDQDDAAEGGEDDTGEDDTVDLPDGVVVVDGHMTVDSLLEMTKKDLLGLAADMNLKANGKMSKDAIAAMISEVDVSYDEDAVPPELTQEVPAV